MYLKKSLFIQKDLGAIALALALPRGSARVWGELGARRARLVSGAATSESFICEVGRVRLPPWVLCVVENTHEGGLFGDACKDPVSAVSEPISHQRKQLPLQCVHWALQE